MVQLIQLQVHLKTTVPYLVFAVALLTTPATICAEDVEIPSNSAPSAMKSPPRRTLKNRVDHDPKLLPPHSQRSLELNEQGASAVAGRDFTRAENLFKQALASDPKNLTAAFNLAGVYISNKNEKEAISLLSSYIAKFPDDVGLIARLGDAYFGSQDITSAEREYTRALTQDPGYPGIANKLATIYSLTGKVSKAAAMYESVLKQTPKDAQALSNLSSLYVALGKPKEAVATAKAAIQVAPSRDLYVTLGNAYLDLKENSNALHAFERAAAMSEAGSELTKQIDELRASLK